MTLKEISETSLSRCNRWHKGGIEDWSPLEWAAAMAGEAGEACNAAKKLKRITDGILNINVRSITEVTVANREIAKEVADTILYAVCLASRVGFSGKEFEDILAEVFNKKSEEYGFPERL